MELAGYWGVGDPELHARLEQASCEAGRLLRGDRWAIATTRSTPGVSISADSDAVIPVLDSNGETCGLLVGHLYPRTADRLPAYIGSAALTGAPGSELLTELVWGSYVVAAVFGDARSSQLLSGGDPIGLRSLFWTRHHNSGIVFASRLADLIDLLGHQPGFDWDYLRGFLARGELPVTTTGLKGIRVISAGTRLEVDTRGICERMVWSPFTLAADGAADPPSATELRALIAKTVDAWAGQAENVYVELSGGLDSAVIAHALVASGRRVVGGHFHHGASAMADEQSYACAVAEHLGVELVLIDVEEALPFTLIPGAGRRWAAPGGHLAWESLPAAHRRVATEHGCQVVMSGAGGDHVFVARSGAPFYMHDSLQHLGPRATWSDLVEFSRVQGLPLVRLLADVVRWSTAHRRGTAALLSRILGADSPPPWLIGAAPPSLAGPLLDFVPDAARPRSGKLAQALEMVLLGCAVGARHGTASPDQTAFPLLSEPLVELGLRAPMPTLIDATRDRILLREAMRDLLPAVLLQRTSKGEHTATWQKGMRANFSLVRDLVVDGAAAAGGIIDPKSALAALTAAALGHTGRLWPLVNLLSVELWIRSWTSGEPTGEPSGGGVAECAQRR